MSIFIRARFDVRDQRHEDFEQIALALRDQARDEPGTLTYRWFSSGIDSYLVLEEYADSAAAMAHNERAAGFLERVAQCAEMVHAEVYGTIGPEIAEWARAQPQVTTFADFPDQAQAPGESMP
jgi:quinol monooxygenase YgiN